MKSKKAEGLFQLAFYLAVMFFSLSMFLVYNPIPMLFLIFLFLSLGCVGLVMLLAVKQRSKRAKQEDKKSRIVPYL